MKGWSPPRAEPWPLAGQLAAMGLACTEGRDTWFLERERLCVHLCARAACAECSAAKREGWRTLRVTREEVLNGVALDRIGRETWRRVEGGLF